MKFQTGDLISVPNSLGQYELALIIHIQKKYEGDISFSFYIRHPNYYKHYKNIHQMKLYNSYNFIIHFVHFLH